MLSRQNFCLIWPLVVLAGCGEIRPPTPAREDISPTYLGQVKPLFARACVKCHNAKDPSGNYDLSSYAGCLGPGSDLTRNLILGDAQSVLLTKLEKSQNPQHWSYLLPEAATLEPGENEEDSRAKDLQMLKDWVTQNQLAYFDSSVHPASWVYPKDRQSLQFHGGELRKRHWNLDACRGCHGENLDGGTSQKSCFSCHQNGPLGCTVCHGAEIRQGEKAYAPPPDLSWNLSPEALGVGAHQKHLVSTGDWEPLHCEDCHRVPDYTFEGGHLEDQSPATDNHNASLGTDGSVDFRAEVIFSKRAQLGGISAAYDRQTHTCNVSCHGKLDGGAQTTWIWNQPFSSPTKCGFSHGLPPEKTLQGSKHSDVTNCAACHKSAYDGQGNLDPKQHLNGKVDL